MFVFKKGYTRLPLIKGGSRIGKWKAVDQISLAYSAARPTVGSPPPSVLLAVRKLFPPAWTRPPKKTCRLDTQSVVSERSIPYVADTARGVRKVFGRVGTELFVRQ